MSKQSVAIIGTGMAGLTLAHFLKGYADVTLFEKSRGVGGRMATRYAGDYEFDHGAQFFIAKSKEFKQFLEPMIANGVIANWNADFVEFSDNKITQSRQWSNKFPHYVGVPKMNYIGKYLARELNVYTQTRVEKIIKEAGKWSLLGKQDQALGKYDWVISNAPSQQTSELLPSLFQHHQTVEKYSMTGCFTLMLGFQTPLNLDWQAALIRDADISWMSVNNSKPERKNKFSLSVLATNAWAEANIDRDHGEVIDHLLAQGSNVTGYDLTKADHIGLQSWRYDNSIKRHDKNPLIDSENKLGACGDWCHQGRVEGAFLSAKSLADQLVSHLV